MFSLGMRSAFAFSIAFASVALPSGSPPPSRAATVMARASFVKSCPRLASAAPFLRLPRPFPLLVRFRGRRVPWGAPPAVTCGDGDGAGELREELPALGVGSAFLALDLRPFGMTGHAVILGGWFSALRIPPGKPD